MPPAAPLPLSGLRVAAFESRMAGSLADLLRRQGVQR